MNYRRGFQRIYCLLFAGYFALFLWQAPAQRLAFWKEGYSDGIANIPFSAGAALFDQDVENLDQARKAGYYSNDEILRYLTIGTRFDVPAARTAGWGDDQIIIYLSALRRRDSLPPEKQALVDELSRRINAAQLSLVPFFVATVPFSHSRAGKSLWLIGYLLLLPGLLYCLLFHVFRWVYFGFKPSAPI